MAESKLRIGQLAQTFGLNTKTLRYYETLGLLPSTERTPAGYRSYGPADRDRLTFIVKAKAVGFTLDEIAGVLEVRDRGQKPCEHVLSQIEEKVATIDEQLRALNDVRQDLLALKEEAISIELDGCVCAIIEHHQRRSPD